MKKIVLAFVLLLVLGLGIYAFAVKLNPKQEKLEVFFGIFREGAPRNMELIKNFESTYSFRPQIIMWYLDWNQKFPVEDCMKVLQYGAIPHIVWEPWIWGDFNAIKINNIINGEWDDYIKTWAKEIKRFQYPIFIRFAHEFNIDGYPWCLIHNNKDPQLYIKMFRYVVDIFRKEGAYNALFVWCPMNYSHPNEAWNDYLKAYPGDDYVDWIGIDGYNWGTSQDWSQWLTFEELFKEPIRKLSKNFPTKPIMIAEFASAPQGGDKAKWILDIPEFIKSTLKPIKAIHWFDLKKEADWRIVAPPTAGTAFKYMIHDPLFKVVNLDGITNLEATSLNAPPKKIVSFFYATTPKIIDGKLTDWDPKNFITLNKIDYVSAGANNWAGPIDLSVRTSYAWDELYLYAIFDVTDDIPFNNNKKDGDIWDADTVEICISLNPADNVNRTKFSKTDFQLGFSTGDYQTIAPSTWIWKLNKPISNADLVVKPKVNEQNIVNGYILEVRIPWKSLANYTPKKGDKLSFTFAVDDSDKTKHREKQMLLNGDYLFYEDPSVWGTTILK